MSRQSEKTNAGEQTLIHGVRLVSLSEKLTAMTAYPCDPNVIQTLSKKPCDLKCFQQKWEPVLRFENATFVSGLFDEVGRAQIDLCDFINSMETSQ